MTLTAPRVGLVLLFTVLGFVAGATLTIRAQRSADPLPCRDTFFIEVEAPGSSSDATTTTSTSSPMCAAPTLSMGKLAAGSAAGGLLGAAAGLALLAVRRGQRGSPTVEAPDSMVRSASSTNGPSDGP